ncbi:MAG: dipeptide epimerase [Deltaproteobacteria bacterium]|nr:MAG: dipeptide epimerase [Deltaproteobacteria bacterium]
MNPIVLSCHTPTFAVRGHFTIARGSVAEVRVLEVQARCGTLVGRGESSPERSGVAVAQAAAEVAAFTARHPFFTREDLLGLMPRGPVRNAIDLALWNLEAQRRGQPVWQLAGLPEPGGVKSAFTISVDQPERMEAAAREASARPLLKIKLTGAGDLERVAAVRRGAPQARLIVDANGAWTPGYYLRMAEPLARLGVELLEQPLPPGRDAELAGLARPVPVYADESCRDRHDLAALVGLYDGVNLKLDKCGGLTEALELKAEARRLGFAVMVGCMLSSSLAVAPALLLAQDADVVDLDAPLLLAEDRNPSLMEKDGLLMPAEARLWG